MLAKKLKYTMVRLHTAWRVTPGESTMSDDMKKQLEEQAPVTIKSGQTPPMYALLHWTNWTDKIKTWTLENVRSECIETRVMVGGKRKRESFPVVHRHMRSLKEYGFPLYAPYLERELKIYRPGTKWTLRIPGTRRTIKKYTL